MTTGRHICWGNGTCFLAKLKPNLIELDGDIQVVDLPRYVEGPWLHKNGNLYYLTYASFGEEAKTSLMPPPLHGRPVDTAAGTGRHGGEQLHHSSGIAEFQGKWYLFYHNATLTLNGHEGAIWTAQRGVCVDELHYNPDGTMRPVVQTKEGITK